MNHLLFFHQYWNIIKTIKTSPPKQVLEDTDLFFIPYSPLVLYKSLVNTDCLFFIQYTSENIFKLCWFLVQVNYAETVKLKINSLYTENHHADFPSRHSKDNQLCVEVS